MLDAENSLQTLSSAVYFLVKIYAVLMFPHSLFVYNFHFTMCPLLSISDEPPLDFLFTATDLIQVKHVNMA